MCWQQNAIRVEFIGMRNGVDQMYHQIVSLNASDVLHTNTNIFIYSYFVSCVSYMFECTVKHNVIIIACHIHKIFISCRKEFKKIFKYT